MPPMDQASGLAGDDEYKFVRFHSKLGDVTAFIAESVPDFGYARRMSRQPQDGAELRAGSGVEG